MHKMDPWTLPMTPYPLNLSLRFILDVFHFCFDDYSFDPSNIPALPSSKTLVSASDSQVSPLCKVLNYYFCHILSYHYNLAIVICPKRHVVLQNFRIFSSLFMHILKSLGVKVQCICRTLIRSNYPQKTIIFWHL